MLQLRGLVAGFLLRTYGVSPRPVIVGFVVDTVAVGLVSLPKYSLPLYQYHSSSAWVSNSCGSRPHL